MTLTIPSRRGFLGGLAATLGGLIAAPTVVRATSLMPVSQRALIAPVAFREAFIQYSIFYEYWVAMGGSIVRRTAEQILSAPLGVYQPWLPTGVGDSVEFRPVNVEQAGLKLRPEHLRQMRGDWLEPSESAAFVHHEKERLAQERARLQNELARISRLSKPRSHT